MFNSHFILSPWVIYPMDLSSIDHHTFAITTAVPILETDWLQTHTQVIYE